MTDVLTYKGHTARIEFDAEDRIFFGKLAGVEDGVGFHGETVDDLVSAFHEAVDDYVDTCGRIGKRDDPGLLRLAVSPDLRAKVAAAARDAGESLDQFGAAALRRAVEAASSRRLAKMGGSDPGAAAAPRRRFD